MNMVIYHFKMQEIGVKNNMAILYFCHRCNTKVECETKADMICECGYYAKDHDDTRNHVNMRNTWAKTTKVEFSSTTMDQDIADRNNR